MNRRDFLNASAIVGAGLFTGDLLIAADPKRVPLKKAVKFGMIGAGKTVQEKFELIKKLGFQGVEIDSPSGLNLKEANEAQKATGIKIHGVVDSVHWRDTLSSPDEKVRAKGLAALIQALEDAKTVGADTVLLVPGVVNKDVTYEDCYKRSQEEVKKAIPTAEKLGVKIAIETVWNNFITKPEQMISYVDDLKSPFVGTYFDCSNMVKYGVSSGDWIRKLGKRLLKFDFKGYSLTKAKDAKNDWKGFDAKIGEGDENWPDVLNALAEVGYAGGWATAEVGGGGEAVLKDIAERMDKILELKPATPSKG
ncbi:sugar phosphate isomerase/epimerase family protein [Zavarzinella formosa]|uniref:sugar phosphate isomerase/epimerase family protein n=1 Tax=Zavarzinella formosa TaxID=360055 RepID=UPI0003061DB7|nr:sugar phosphate isomerase/epimerase family protein [Zavarzinella formosa]